MELRVQKKGVLPWLAELLDLRTVCFPYIWFVRKFFCFPIYQTFFIVKWPRTYSVEFLKYIHWKFSVERAELYCSVNEFSLLFYVGKTWRVLGVFHLPFLFTFTEALPKHLRFLSLFSFVIGNIFNPYPANVDKMVGSYPR